MPLAGGAVLVVDHAVAGNSAHIEHASGASTAVPAGEIHVSADRRWVSIWSPDGAESWASADGTGPTPGQLADGAIAPVVLDDQSIVRLTDTGLEPLAGGPPNAPPSGLVGHWRAADEHGDWVLAEWSGECESPSSLLIPAAGGSPVDIAPGAEGYALGWASDGRAVLHLPEGVCGSTYEVGTGVYLFDPATGALERIYTIAGEISVTAKMWSPLEG